MAAKQQSKKKTRTGKRKQFQKNHRQARQKQLQPHKQKKPWSRHEHRAKAAHTGRLKACSSKLFAAKILRQMPKVRMEAKARGLVKTLLMRLYNQVVTEVKKTLIQKSKPPNISCTDVQTALNDAMAKMLAKHTAGPTGTTASSQCA